MTVGSVFVKNRLFKNFVTETSKFHLIWILILTGHVKILKVTLNEGNTGLDVAEIFLMRFYVDGFS